LLTICNKFREVIL